VQDTLLKEEMQKMCSSVYRLDCVLSMFNERLGFCCYSSSTATALWDRKKFSLFLSPGLWCKCVGLFLFNLCNRKHLLRLRI